MIDQDLEKVLNKIVNLLISMEKRLQSIEENLKKEDKEKVLHG